jgi:hypothetical protein
MYVYAYIFISMYIYIPVPPIVGMCSLLMPYWLGLCVLRRTRRQNRLYETLFHTVIIPSKHHHHNVSVEF